MRKSNVRKFTHTFPLVIVTVIIVCAVWIVSVPSTIVRALPEYANWTGESCGMCHVSPGGAGPLTLTGLSWIADGRSDEVHGFENVLIAPGTMDAQMLYEIACSACHGFYGEGLSGSKLIGFDFNQPFLERVITDGVMEYNMPGFAGQFTDEQLDALVEYVSDLSAGRIVPLVSYPLESGIITCNTHYDQTNCGGN